jgi:Raf kinase inhibitor-like YbhB/YbcL family protein
MREPVGNQSETVAIATTTIEGTAGAPLLLSVPWTEGGAIDPRYTCDGNNVSPAVSWTGGPADVSAWAVILTDLDAPEYAHWAVANIDGSATGITEGVAPDLAAVAMNSDAKPDYSGPCPPEGSSHRYSLSVYGLTQVLEVQTGDPAASMRAAIEAAATEVATSEFTFSR